MNSISESSTPLFPRCVVEGFPSATQLCKNITKIALPIIAIVGSSLLTTAEAGPILYGICVASCGPAAPVCVAACLPLMFAPSP